ncbi:hypothetical protein Hanom_Chr13g01200231 [Helianthus anomalus]
MAMVVAALRRHLLPPFPLCRPLCYWCLVVVALGLVAVALGMVVEPGGRRWLSRFKWVLLFLSFLLLLPFTSSSDSLFE